MIGSTRGYFVGEAQLDKILAMTAKMFKFDQPLKRARIVRRPNRFIMEIELDGETVRAHCPSTGSIGGYTLDDLPCLISGPYPTDKRSTAYTVEAFAVREEDEEGFEWIGINQTAANRYVAWALEQNLLTTHPLITEDAKVKREPKLGSRRLDFLINDMLYVEVKTPLKRLQVTAPSSVAQKPLTPTTVDRMVAQVEEITLALGAGQSATMFTCFMYDNPGFTVPASHSKSKQYAAIGEAMANARQAGMEQWQINFKIEPEGVTLTKFVKLDR